MSKIRIQIEYDISTEELSVQYPLRHTAHVVWLLEVVKAAIVQPKLERKSPLVIPTVMPGTDQ